MGGGQGCHHFLIFFKKIVKLVFNHPIILPNNLGMLLDTFQCSLVFLSTLPMLSMLIHFFGHVACVEYGVLDILLM
jgi:hypothetical protein